MTNKNELYLAWNLVYDYIIISRSFLMISIFIFLIVSNRAMLNLANN